MKKIYSFFILFYCCCPLLFADPVSGRLPQEVVGAKAFRENVGQITDQYGKTRDDVDWHLNNDAVMIYIGQGKMSYQWCRPANATPSFISSLSFAPKPLGQDPFEVYRMDVVLLGANADAAMVKEMPRKNYENYYREGKDALRAHYYQKVTYKEIYPHIDWVLFLKDNQLKYEFIVRPGGRVQDIRLQYRGTEELSISQDGNLAAITPMGRVEEQKPYTYQAGDESNIPSSYSLSDNILSFKVAPYEGTLVIDPFINVEWSTYYGGIGTESSIVQYTQFSGTSYFNPSMVVDGRQNAIVYGTTSSRENIATTGSHLAIVQSMQNAFIVKMNNKGERLWATYYGDGNPSNSATVSGSGNSVACDGQGNIYIAGTTGSAVGIATKGAFQEEFSGWQDMFLVKFDQDGNRLWGTYYGSSRAEYHGSVAVTADGSRIYLAGSTEGPSDDLVTPAAFFPFSGSYNRRVGFLVSFNGSGNRQWGTFIQPTNIGYTDVIDLAVDNSGNVFVGGTSFSDEGAFFTTDLSIVSFGAHQSVNITPGPYGRDAFLQKWDAGGKRLWGTFYGGAGQDYGNGITCDEQGNVYMTGGTMSPTAIATQGSWQENFDGNLNSYQTNAFVVQFNAGGQRRWGTYLGGESTAGTDLACGEGGVFVTGATANKLPADSCAYQNKNNGQQDAFIALFNREGVKQELSFFGGEGGDVGFSMAATNEEGRTVVYLAGQTTSLRNIAFSRRNPLHKDKLIGNNADYFLTRFAYSSTRRELVSCFGADSLLILPWYAGKAPYLWNNGARTDSLWVKTSGQYIVSYQFGGGCPVQDTVDVHLYPLPQLQYTDSACTAGQGTAGFALATVSKDNDNSYRYEWYDVAGKLLQGRDHIAGDSIGDLPPGTYTLQVKTPVCDTSLHFTIQAYPEVILDIVSDTTIAAGQQVQLWVRGEGVDSVLWSPAQWLDTFYSFTPIASPEAPVTYIATGTNSHGCFNSASVRIYIMEDLFVPNAFSPNGDGINDVFQVVNGGYRQMLDFSIFNRWGQRVFSGASRIAGGWDGTFKGQVADAGVYHYYIKTVLRDKVEIFKGDLTLIR